MISFCLDFNLHSQERLSDRRRASFPRTSDTPEGQAQLRASQRQRTQGPGRYQSERKRISWLIFHIWCLIFTERRGCFPTNLQVLQEIPLWIFRVDKSRPLVIWKVIQQWIWSLSLSRSRTVVKPPRYPRSWGIVFVYIDCCWIAHGCVNAKWLHMFIYTSTHVCTTYCVVRLSA